MIYWLLFYEFFKIGLFAVGGGLVVVPFLFELADGYGWFSTKELANMIAIAESTPGPLGVNMATYAGYNAAGIMGAIIATLGLVSPSVIIIVGVAKLIARYKGNERLQQIFKNIRPAVLALILLAGLQIGQMAIVNLTDGLMFALLLGAIRFYRRSPIFYLAVAAVAGIVVHI